MFASDTQCLSCVMFALSVNHRCMNAYFVLTVFPAIDSNDECAEEGEVFEYQEEGDKGQANQCKPTI
jgi:hypothetical protein